MNFLLSLIKSGLKVTVYVWAAFFALFTILIVFSIIGAAGGSSEGKPDKLTTEYYYGDFDSKNKVLSLPITGIILGDKAELGEFGSFLETPAITFGYEIKHQLEEAAENTSIKAVVLEINSPGGTIYGSQAIADGVKLYKEKTGNPVVGYVSGLAASGGYWAAVATDHIIADYGTGTGSIGVISGPFKFYDGVVAEEAGLLNGGVVTENGIQSFYVSAGESKDLGNPYRKMSDSELQSLQTMVNNEYNVFVAHVAQHRSMSPEYVRGNLKALLYDAASAKEKNLIDDIGSREASYTYTVQQAGIKKDEYQVIRPKRQPGLVEQLFGATSFLKAPTSQSTAINSSTIVCGRLNSVVLAYHGSLGDLCQ